MRKFYSTLIILAAFLAAGQADAFMLDNNSGVNADGTPKFTDPDDQVESPFVTLGNPQSNFNSGNNSQNNGHFMINGFANPAGSAVGSPYYSPR